MSLFLQVLVLRGLLFREQGHRQERIGVGMTLWPPGRNEEKKRMKWRLATSICSGFMRMNSGYRIHGYLFDTSEMMYLDTDNTWVRRDLVPSAAGDPVVHGKAQFGPQSPQNGILGDARRSTVELGKLAIDMKVDYAVRQIRGLLPPL